MVVGNTSTAVLIPCSRATKPKASSPRRGPRSFRRLRSTFHPRSISIYALHSSTAIVLPDPYPMAYGARSRRNHTHRCPNSTAFIQPCALLMPCCANQISRGAITMCQPHLAQPCRMLAYTVTLAFRSHEMLAQSLTHPLREQLFLRSEVCARDDPARAQLYMLHHHTLFWAGNCDFIEKVRISQRANAKAVVVANNEGEHLFKMYSSDEDTSDVTIPSVFVTTSTGERLPGAYIALNATGECRLLST
eukprot:SAG11_NODE_2122_length_3784_cov_3.569878_5_plen_248_part_00